MLDKDIIFSLRKFNKKIKSDDFNPFTINSVRERLTAKGQFKPAVKLNSEDMAALINNRPITAIDGSRLEYGAFYPYYLAFLRTMAGTTGDEDIIDSEVLTPLNPETQNIVEGLAQKNKISNDEGLKLYLKRALAQMELKTAISAVKKYRPYMLILDGGFLLFDKLAEWDLLCAECLQNNTILVGVIEEVATAEVAPMIGIEAINRPRIYDRELLFGLFSKGEYLQFYLENKFKKDYATVFARLSTSPQAIAIDFLPDQEIEIERVLNLLYTLTPANGQGIPSWLQLVDAQVRLRKKEVDRLLYTCIDTDLIEKYFIPNRERRIY